MARLAAAGLVLTLAAVPARAQNADSGAASLASIAMPARPKLDAGADTNSAQANYAYGMKRIEE